MSAPLFISSEKLREASERYNSWKDEPVPQKRPSREELIPFKSLEISEPELSAEADPLVLATDQRRIDMLNAVSKEPPRFAYDRAIGKNDAVYSNFIELIAEAKRKTGRIVIKDSGKAIGYATGFMVSENLMLTNWHVFNTKADVRDSEIQFFYEYDTQGVPTKPLVFRLDPAVFFHADKRLDYCFVAVKPFDTTGSVPLTSIGYIFLEETIGKLGNEGEESLNIIHHPEGDYKQLSIRENLLQKKLTDFLWYKTDTAQGSSGAAVFNDQWQVVALHHMGVPKMLGELFVDKDGNPFGEEDGLVDISRVVWEANEGVRISSILKDLFTIYPNSAVTNKLKIYPRATSQLPAVPIENKTGAPVSSPDTIQISLPASVVPAGGTFTISLGGQGVSPISGQQALNGSAHDLLEYKKLEDEMDYSTCRGYQSNFLGMDIKLPKPKTKLKKFIAKIKNSNSTELKYHHYSVLFHSVRMMPAISAINVDSDPLKRKDYTKRDDKWLKDNRLSYDIQLGDDFYAKSGFDRGHMSRREDANWGNTAEDALRFANLTCLYTNACPQVGDLNRSNLSGLWGILEQVVLEKGASKETGNLGRISVFNGPIFRSDDPVFRGVQVPLDFFKVILWLDDEQQLKATAFKLSQENLVDDIDFFHEAIDVHLNPVFKEYQVGIKWLSAVTELNFAPLEKFDTFAGQGPVPLKTVEQLHESIEQAKKLSSR
jgi:endonuclease G, mitochondrial